MIKCFVKSIIKRNISSIKSLLILRLSNLKNPSARLVGSVYPIANAKNALKRICSFVLSRLYVFRAFTRSSPFARRHAEIVNPNGIPRELRRDFRTRTIFREALLHRVYRRDLSLPRESRRSTIQRDRDSRKTTF